MRRSRGGKLRHLRGKRADARLQGGRDALTQRFHGAFGGPHCGGIGIGRMVADGGFQRGQPAGKGAHHGGEIGRRVVLHRLGYRLQRARHVIETLVETGDIVAGGGGVDPGGKGIDAVAEMGGFQPRGLDGVGQPVKLALKRRLRGPRERVILVLTLQNGIEPADQPGLKAGRGQLRGKAGHLGAQVADIVHHLSDIGAHGLHAGIAALPHLLQPGADGLQPGFQHFVGLRTQAGGLGLSRRPAARGGGNRGAGRGRLLIGRGGGVGADRRAFGKGAHMAADIVQRLQHGIEAGRRRCGGIHGAAARGGGAGQQVAGGKRSLPGTVETGGRERAQVHTPAGGRSALAGRRGKPQIVECGVGCGNRRTRPHGLPRRNSAQAGPSRSGAGGGHRIFRIGIAAAAGRGARRCGLGANRIGRARHARLPPESLAVASPGA